MHEVDAVDDVHVVADARLVCLVCVRVFGKGAIIIISFKSFPHYKQGQKQPDNTPKQERTWSISCTSSAQQPTGFSTITCCCILFESG